MDSVKYHYLFSANEKITIKHSYISDWNHILWIYIGTYYSLSLRSQFYYLPHVPLNISIQNKKTEHFQHTQAQQLE